MCEDCRTAMQKAADFAASMEKGRKIWESGGVTILDANPQEITAIVISDRTGEAHEVTLSKKSWENADNVGGWLRGFLCDCAWGQRNSGDVTEGGWKGRLCKHACAVIWAIDGWNRVPKAFQRDYRVSSLRKRAQYSDFPAYFTEEDIEDLADHDVYTYEDYLRLGSRNANRSMRRASRPYANRVTRRANRHMAKRETFQEKAHRLADEGAVTIDEVEDDRIFWGHCSGYGVYVDTRGSDKVQDWGCDCDWAKWWDKNTNRKGWDGRMCSHAYAQVLAEGLDVNPELIRDKQYAASRRAQVEEDYSFPSYFTEEDIDEFLAHGVTHVSSKGAQAPRRSAAAKRNYSKRRQ